MLRYLKACAPDINEHPEGYHEPEVETSARRLGNSPVYKLPDLEHAVAEELRYTAKVERAR